MKKVISTFIEEKLTKVLEKLNYPLKPKVIISNRKDLCDYQFDGAFSLAKELHENPFNISEKITAEFQKMFANTSFFTKIEAVRPGFINFTLSDTCINEILNHMKESDKFAITMPAKETIIIDYGGPNIAKPLHVGHLRSAIVCESIKRILKYYGHEVISDVHLGDYGLQIGQVIYGLKSENISINDITIEILDRIYPKMSGLCKENDEIKTICAQITKDLQDGNQEYQAYFVKIREVSGKDILRIYDYLYVHFDLWYGESNAYPYIDKAKQALEAKKLLKQSEGALIVDVAKSEDSKDLPPFIFQKSNGAYLYGTTDLATIFERIIDYNPQKILYVTDLRQGMHFTQLFRVCEKLGITKNTNFEHLGFGTVNGLDGRPYKTRAGTAPKLDELFTETKEAFLNSNPKNTSMDNEDLDILVNAIIKFADLQNNREKDYIFDSKKFSSVIGKTGPYILYTYLRIANILTKENYISTNKLTNTIYNNVDRELRMKILELENALNYSYTTRLPSILANYLYELCVNLNAFYENNHINNLEDVKKKEDWLILLDLSCKIIKDMLYLLGINIPKKM